MRKAVDKRGKKRAERHVSAALRIGVAALTLLLQIAVILLLTMYMRRYATMVYLILELVALAVAIGIFNRNGSPSYKVSWILLVLAVPVAGTILYVLWGGNHQAKHLSLKRVPPPAERESTRMESADNLIRLGRKCPNWERLAASLHKRGFLLYRNTKVRYFPEGEAFFADLIHRASQAERYIFLEYYILAEGKLWDRLFEVLQERSAAGVEIKIIFDDFGNITRLSDAMLQRIQDAGIEVQVFNPVHKYVNRIYFNYRDHRKIAAIDGQFAYTGGLNIADEYANLVERFGYWKDCGVRLEGEGAWGLTREFIYMWERMDGEMHSEHDYYRPVHHVLSQGFCQTLVDGPDDNPDAPAEDLFLQLITRARQSVYVTTPYLAIDEPMMKALCLAGDSGVDVRLLMPGIPDHKFAYLVAESYFEELMEHHVKIYTFTPGLIHGKTAMADREIAFVGSVNMDYRSFQLHFECGEVLYGVPAIESLLEDMDRIADSSELMTPQRMAERPLWRRALGTVLRLFAMWM